MGDSNARLDLSGHHDESFLDVLAVLGRSFKESNIVVLCEFLSFIGGDLACVGQVALVADKDARDVVRSVFLNFVHPVLDCAETFTIGDIVSHNDTVCALIVAAGDGLESFLASGIPLLNKVR